MDSIKQGDSIPLAGAIRVFEGPTEVTMTIDFSSWSVTFGMRQSRGDYFYNTTIPVAADGVFAHEVPSSETLAMEANQAVLYDIRIRDDLGTIVSTQTQEVLVLPPIAGVP